MPTYLCRAGHKHRSQTGAVNCGYCKNNDRRKEKRRKQLDWGWKAMQVKVHQDSARQSVRAAKDLIWDIMHAYNDAYKKVYLKDVQQTARAMNKGKLPRSIKVGVVYRTEDEVILAVHAGKGPYMRCSEMHQKQVQDIESEFTKAKHVIQDMIAFGILARMRV